MAILKKSGDECSFVWGADPDTKDVEDGGVPAGGGWFYAEGQPDACTRVTVRALPEDDAIKAAGDRAEAWRLGVVAIDGETVSPKSWPPLFVSAVASLVTFVQSGIVGMSPPVP